MAHFLRFRSGGVSLSLGFADHTKAQIGDAPDIGAYELNGRTPDVDGPQMPPVPEERPSIDEFIEQSKGTLLAPRDTLRNKEHWDTFGDVPVIVWDDKGERAGPVLDGGRFSFRQQGEGSWRDIRIWSCR